MKQHTQDIMWTRFGVKWDESEKVWIDPKTDETIDTLGLFDRVCVSFEKLQIAQDTRMRCASQVLNSRQQDECYWDKDPYTGESRFDPETGKEYGTF